MRPRAGMWTAIAALALALVAGCTETSVQPERTTHQTSLARPVAVLVYEPSVTAREVRANQERLRKDVDAVDRKAQRRRTRQLMQEASEAFADELVEQIKELGLHARRASRGAPVPANALVITCQFVDVDAGSQIGRLVIGLGAGQAKIDTQVQVLAPGATGYQTLLEFKTHADSGELPGAAVTMGAGAAVEGGVTVGMAAANAAVGGVKTYRSAMGAMAARSADRAVAYLSKFFARENWIPPDQSEPSLS